MRLYLMQHGRPVAKEENRDRPLSDQGKREETWTANLRFQDCSDPRMELFPSTGKVTMKIDPFPGVLLAVIVPR